MSTGACYDAAAWTQAYADDAAQKSKWFRATSRQNFINAYEWGQKATFAFHAGDANAAAWYKAIADDYSRKSIADAQAADSYSNQALSYFNASQDSLNRAEFFAVAGEGAGYGTAGSNGRKCEHTVRHRSDPDALGSGQPNTFGCEYWDTQVRACDRDVDGHRVRLDWVGSLDGAYFWFPPEPYWSTDWAPSRGCVDQGIGASGTVIKFRVCVEHEGCTPWKRNVG